MTVTFLVTVDTYLHTGSVEEEKLRVRTIIKIYHMMSPLGVK